MELVIRWFSILVLLVFAAGLVWCSWFVLRLMMEFFHAVSWAASLVHSPAEAVVWFMVACAASILVFKGK